MHIEDAEEHPPVHWFYDVRDQLKRHIYNRSEKLFAAGDAARDAITSRPQLEERQKKIRSAVIAGIGGLPSMDTPLNARTVGELKGNGFKIEKIIFESRPNVI